MPTPNLARKYHNNRPNVVIQTQFNQWVIPESSSLLKALLKQQRIRAGDLQFGSRTECKNFIKKLFLLAVEDEHKSHKRSWLAQFGRELMQTDTQPYMHLQ